MDLKRMTVSLHPSHLKSLFLYGLALPPPCPNVPVKTIICFRPDYLVLRMKPKGVFVGSVSEEETVLRRWEISRLHNA